MKIGQYQKLPKPIDASTATNCRKFLLKKNPAFNTVLASIFLFTSFLAQQTLANDTESKVKAAFIYKFCGYVKWPEYTFSAKSSPIIIAVAGDDSQVKEIYAMISDRKIGDRPLNARKVSSTNDLDGAHVLYMSRDFGSKTNELTGNLNTLPILTIADEETSSSSSIITFLTINDRIRFDISLKRSEEVGIKLSSELLSVAHRIIGGHEQ